MKNSVDKWNGKYKISIFAPVAFQEGGVKISSYPSDIPRHSRNDFITLKGFKIYVHL